MRGWGLGWAQPQAGGRLKVQFRVGSAWELGCRREEPARATSPAGGRGAERSGPDASARGDWSGEAGAGFPLSLARAQGTPSTTEIEAGEA